MDLKKFCEENDISASDKDGISTWAENEVELAIASEKEAAKGTDDWRYGVTCYKSALRTYLTMLRDNHSGTSIQITKSILNRLIDGKCLTPIEDTDDIWNEITWSKEGSKEFQCKRMSSLFKKVTADGEVSYSDINRVQCVNIDSPNIAYHDGLAARLINKISPITMPYLPTGKPFKVVCENFLFDPKGGGYDTIAYLYIILPNGKTIDLNRYFKEDENGQMVHIEKEEYEERKKNRIKE